MLLALLLSCQTITGKDFAQLDEDCSETRCAPGLVCGHAGVCAEEGALGTLEEDADCTAAEECAYGLVCSSENLCASPGADGTGGTGDSCKAAEDCQAGFYCDESGSCQDIGIPYWAGGACPDDDPDSFRAVFEVPRLPALGELDFFSLPFPNDFRRDTSQHPDLSGLPTPPGAPAVSALVSAIQTDTTGFGRNPTVYFRFSQSVDSDSLKVLTDNATIHWASIDTQDAGYGERSALKFFYRTSRGKYICQNWLAVSVFDGDPLPPSATQAVWITSGVKNKAGDHAKRDAEFELMMDTERPDGYAQAQAWDAYEPFREYVTEQGLDAATIVSAAVFTPGNPENRTRYFDDQAVGAVSISKLVQCGNGASPCGTGCDKDPNGYDELRGLLTVPEYRDAAGHIQWNELAKPVIQGSKEVCVSLTIPESGIPADGWPIALLAPDLDRGVDEAIQTGLAGELAGRSWATLTVEPPTAADLVRPDDPARWLAAELQQVSDLQAAVELLKTWELDPADSPTGNKLAWNTSQSWLVAHGQGGIAGLAALSWSSTLQGAVIGNVPGYVAAWLPESFAPIDTGHGLQAAFADSSVDIHHPMMSLFQLYFEPTDPVDNASFVVRDSHVSPANILAIDGVTDTNAPRLAFQSTLRAMDIPTGGTVIDDYGQSTSSLPANGNVSTSAGRRTAASLQYNSGHEALYTDALTTVGSFLESSESGTPTISP